MGDSCNAVTGFPRIFRVGYGGRGPEDFDLVAHELRRAGFDYRCLRVETEADYVAQQQARPDIILSDYSAPGFDALRALQLMQEQGLDIPFIVLSGTVDEEMLVECMKRGAADYLLKDRLVRLGPAVARALSECKLRGQERQADAALKEANRAKSDFLARMSHEIRTPLHAILGMADLLWDSRLDDDQRQYIRAFRRAGDNLLTLVNDLLDLTKIEAGRVDLLSVDFDLDDLVAAALDLMRVRADDKGLDILCELSPEIGRLRGDPDRLRQVLINLLGNSVKFTKEGHVRLRIERESAPADGIETLRFSVSDTGAGIPLDKQALIFETFTQADGSISHQYGGTGLGLTISRQIVERMGGRLEVSSIPGRGSTFSFAISFAPGTRQASSPDAAGCLLSDEAPAARLRILLAEDSPDNQLLISAYLKQTAMTLEIAEDGQIAVDKFTAGAFDVVLMDVQMPVMDGYTAAYTIRAWEARQGARRTPILTLSAHAMEEAFRKSLAAGCDAHLTKPILKAALLQAIVDALQGSRPDLRPPFEGGRKTGPWYLDRRRTDLVTLAAARWPEIMTRSGSWGTT